MAATRPPFVAVPKSLYDALWGLSHAQLVVVLYIVRKTIGHYNRNEGASVSVRSIADDTGLSKNAVHAALQELKGLGVVIEKRRAAGSRGAVLAVDTNPANWIVSHSEGRKSALCPTSCAVVSHSEGRSGQFVSHSVTPLEEESEDLTEDSSLEGCAAAHSAAAPSEDEDPTTSALTVEEGEELVRDWLASVRGRRRAAVLRDRGDDDAS